MPRLGAASFAALSVRAGSCAPSVAPTSIGSSSSPASGSLDGTCRLPLPVFFALFNATATSNAGGLYALKDQVEDAEYDQQADDKNDRNNPQEYFHFLLLSMDIFNGHLQ
ncbi:hypothetical protein [Noviherbaspirillum agri]